MIDDLKPYPALKDSGVPWLGALPEHWAVTKVKNLARSGFKTFIDGDWIESPYITSHGIRLIQTGNIGVGMYREKGFRYISNSTFQQLNCTEFHPKDVLICRLGEPVGRACLAPDLGVRMITSVDVCILMPREGVSPGFVVYAMSSPQYLDWVNSLVRGSTRDRVSRSMLGAFMVPLPPCDEQAAIVRFLDHADRRIRRYIRAKQKLIKLLEEQKQAIIHRAVTLGLEPNVRFKPSGVEWLGDVPEHWEVKKLRLLFRYAKGRRAAELTNEYIGRHSGSFPVFSGQTEANGLMGNIDWYEFDFSEPVVFVTTVGARAMSTRLVSGRFSLSQNCALIIPRGLETVSAYFEPVLQRVFDYEKASISLIMQPSLRFGDLNRLHVPVPPVPEQRTIVRFLDEEITRLSCETERAHHEISLLREYRTRLIADVVTGKLDVREAAARVPDEVEELESLEETDAEEVTDDLEVASEEAEA